MSQAKKKTTKKVTKQAKKKTRRSAKSTKMKDEARAKLAEAANEKRLDAILELVGDALHDNEREDIEKVQRRAGRPSKYQKDIHPLALEALMSEGLSFEASCAQMGICSETGQQWAKKYPEFSVSKKRGEELSRLWWEQKGKRGMFFGKDFNGTVWVFAMKNRFGWKDKNDINLGGQPGNPIHATGPLGQIIDDLQFMDEGDLDAEVQRILNERKTPKK